MIRTIESTISESTHTYTESPLPLIPNDQMFTPDLTVVGTLDSQYKKWLDSQWDRVESTYHYTPDLVNPCGGGCGGWVDPESESNLGDRDPVWVESNGDSWISFCCESCGVRWGIHNGIFTNITESRMWWESLHVTTGTCGGLTVPDLITRDQES